jgi:mono/diheme cytochrome c family protein
MPTVVIASAALSLFAASSAAPVQAPGVDSGAHIAQIRCAACHAVGPQGTSPKIGAPPFTQIRMRYNALSLESELARISKQGHYDMRPLTINPDEARDLAAYIESLGPAAY